MLLALTIAVSVLTFVAEAIGIGLSFNVSLSPWRVLQMAFDFDLDSYRPGWAVLGAGLLVVAVDLVRARFGQRRPARPRPAGLAAGKPTA
jgi:hypothetical protein